MSPSPMNPSDSFLYFLAFSQGKKYPARLRGLRFYRVGEQRHDKVSKF
jgi:hypothetical protein